jgi:hypothetical protein
MEALNTTVAGIRALTGPDAGAVYQTTDFGGGQWYYDTADTTSLDNTGTILVSADGSRFKRIYQEALSPIWFGAKGDGTTNDTAAIQGLLNQLPANSTVDFGNHTYLVDEINIYQKSYLTVIGKGATILGSLLIGSRTDTASFNYQLVLKDLKFDLSYYPDSLSRKAITLANAVKCEIEGLKFKGSDACFYVYPVNRGQHCARISIRGCITEENLSITDPAQRGANYFLHVDNAVTTAPYTGIILGIGDFSVQNNNSISVNIAHILAFGVDGMLIQGNTFFHSGGFYKSQTKTQNIRIAAANWIHIENNQLFEAGYEGILLEKFANCNIGHNNIAWCGQRDVNYGTGIRLTGGGYPDTSYCGTVVADNVINLPTRSGFAVEDNCHEVIVTGNHIKNPGNVSHYYGTGVYPMGNSLNVPLITSVTHYAGEVSALNQDCLTANNVCFESPYSLLVNEAISVYKRSRNFNNIDVGGIVNYGQKVAAAIVSGKLDVTNTQFLSLNITTGGTVSGLSNGNTGQMVTVYNGSSPVTFTNSSTMLFANNVDLVLPFRGSVTLLKTLNAWYEITRSAVPAAITYKTGLATVAGSGTVNVLIPHTLGSVPSNFDVKAANSLAAGDFYLDYTNTTSTNLAIVYLVAPASGSLQYSYIAYK